MSEETTTTETSTPAEPTDKATAASELLVQIAARVKASAPQVTARYIDSQVEAEIANRAGLLDKAMQHRFKLQGDLRKVDRPDEEKFDANGKVVQAFYTKPRLEEIKKIKEALVKVEKAIDLAVTSNDWSKIKEVAK